MKSKFGCSHNQGGERQKKETSNGFYLEDWNESPARISLIVFVGNLFGREVVFKEKTCYP